MLVKFGVYHNCNLEHASPEMITGGGGVII